MTLQDYLKHNKMTPADFANVMGDVSEYGVRKWATGERVPRREAMRRIEQVTNGQVSPADFFGPVDQPQDDQTEPRDSAA